MNDYPASNEPEGQNNLTAEAPKLLWSPNDAYTQSRKGVEAYLGSIPDHALKTRTKDWFSTQSYGSSQAAAAMMRQVSDYIWGYNNLYSWFGISSGKQRTPLQETFNHKLCTHGDQETLNTIKSDDLCRLFPEGKKQEWPHLVLTSNHARAWVHEDVSELMHGYERLLQDVGMKPSQLARFNKDTPRSRMVGKTLVISAVHSERDPFLNGAELIERRNVLRETMPKTAEDMQNRSREHMSPASMRLAKLMFKLMCEPKSQPLVNLDCSEIDRQPALRAHPYIADYIGLLQKETMPVSHPLTLRKDAAEIASHIRLTGFSKGANTVTDAMRFFYQELKNAQKMTKRRELSGAAHELTDKDIRELISRIEVLSIAPGEVPLSDVERKIAGIRRNTIINANDIVAGQYTQYGKEEGDNVITIEGVHENSGHGPRDTLGYGDKRGFIMDPARAVGDNEQARAFRRAQEVVRQFTAPLLGTWQAKVSAGNQQAIEANRLP